MALDLLLLVAIAEIAGIFVGFGALIGAIRPNEIAAAQLARLRGLVTIGLTIIVAALVPYIQLFSHAPMEKRLSLKIK